MLRPDSARIPDAGVRAPRWRLRLLGAVELEGAHGETTPRFPSRAIVALLAMLALRPGEAQSRVALVERLWPGVELSVGRNRLRQALSTLKSLLESAAAPASLPSPPRGAPARAASATTPASAPPAPSAPAPPVLAIDRTQVHVLPGILVCDVQEFEAACRDGRRGEARALYRGELLPGHDEPWVLQERLRLQHLFDQLEQGAALPAACAPAERTAQAAARPAPASHGGLPVVLAAPWLPRFDGMAWFGPPSLRGELAREVAAHRLVTLSGAAGCGKTRLAAELAQALSAATNGRAATFDLVAFVPLADAATAGELAEQVLAVLLPRPLPGLAGAAALRHALAGRRALLVLDGLEELGAGAPADAAAVCSLADALPQAHLLLTARAPLALEGARGVGLDALALPPAGPAPVTLGEAASSTAVQLLVARARGAGAALRLGARNAPVLVALARRTGAIPGALELVAPMLRGATPSQLLQQLSNALREAAPPQAPLHATARPSSPHPLRQGSPQPAADTSLDALVAWRWARLDVADVDLLAAATVFGAPFDAAALAFVAERDDAGPRLATLARHSLVQVTLSGTLTTAPTATAPHFRLPAALRAQATASLTAARAAACRARHREWLLRPGAAHASEAPAAPGPRAVAAAELAAALAAALQDGVPDDALRLLVARQAALADARLPAPVLDLFARALARAGGPGDLRSRAHALLGLLRTRAGCGHARADVDRAVALAAPGSAARAAALHAAATLRWRSEGNAAAALASINEARACPGIDDETRAGVLSLAGTIAGAHERDPARAAALQHEAHLAWQRAGNTHALAASHHQLALCALQLARPDEAMAQLQAAAAAARALRAAPLLALVLNTQGRLCARRRDWAGAVAAHREAAAEAWASLETRALLFALWHAPRALARLRHADVAARTMAFAATAWAAQVGRLKADDLAAVRRVRGLCTALLGAQRTAALWAEGGAATLAEATGALCAVRP